MILPEKSVHALHQAVPGNPTAETSAGELDAAIAVDVQPSW